MASQIDFNWFALRVFLQVKLVKLVISMFLRRRTNAKSSFKSKHREIEKQVGISKAHLLFIEGKLRKCM